jgi:hypothetical protein
MAHCRAMAAFCRQHAQFENENSSFWIEEAKEWDGLITEYSKVAIARDSGLLLNSRQRSRQP